MCILSPDLVSLIMIFFQYSCYLLISALSAVVVLSSPELQDSTLLTNPDWAINPDAVSNDDTNGNQGSLIASGNLQGQNLWHGDSVLPSQLGGYDTNILSDQPKDSIVLFDGNDGVTNIAPPTFPNPLRIFFPNGLPEFDPSGVIRWFTEPKEPSCDDDKFSFCCQVGPPIFTQKKQSPIATEERKQEIQRRLRKCLKWSADNPACFFPENQACCDCKASDQTAYECYNPNWRNDPHFQGTSQRKPVLLPKRNRLTPDPNPSEPIPEQLGGEKRKREWSGQLFDNEEMNTPATVGMPGKDDSSLYATKYQRLYVHPGGMNRFESTCSDEYLAKKDRAPLRYQDNPVFTPKQPFLPKGTRQGGKQSSPKDRPQPGS